MRISTSCCSLYIAVSSVTSRRLLSFLPLLKVKIKFFYTRYRVLGQEELIPVYTYFIAAGSQPALPADYFFSHPRPWTSTKLMLGDRGTSVRTTCPRLLCSFVTVGIQPTTYIATFASPTRYLSTPLRQLSACRKTVV